jgi:hypothetical protein
MLRVSCVCLGVALALGAAGVSFGQTLSEPSPIAPPSQPAPPPVAVPPALQNPAGSLPVRVIDQPLSVKVIEQSKSDAQFDAEQKQRADRAAFSDQLLILAALAVAICAFLAIAFTVQVFYLGLGLRSMRRSAQKAERNVMVMQRAFVYVSDLTWNAAGDSIKVSPIWANSGASPTRKLRISTNWKASHSELRPDFDINYVRAPENLFLGPGARVEFGALFIPMREVQAAAEQGLYLYVWGRATYEDMFEGTKPHFFEFCHRLEVAGETPDNIGVAFQQFGLSNGSDGDSLVPADA